MKYSKQRELVLDTVMQHRTHPTADFVYSFLRSNNPNISLGTVYRNLNLLAEHRLILKIPIPNGSDRFDGRTDEHYHMICNACGEVYDVGLDNLGELDRDIQNSTGFTVTGHDIIIKGICKECSKYITLTERGEKTWN